MNICYGGRFDSRGKAFYFYGVLPRTSLGGGTFQVRNICSCILGQQLFTKRGCFQKEVAACLHIITREGRGIVSLVFQFCYILVCSSIIYCTSGLLVVRLFLAASTCLRDYFNQKILLSKDLLIQRCRRTKKEIWLYRSVESWEHCQPPWLLRNLFWWKLWCPSLEERRIESARRTRSYPMVSNCMERSSIQFLAGNPAPAGYFEDYNPKIIYTWSYFEVLAQHCWLEDLVLLYEICRTQSFKAFMCSFSGPLRQVKEFVHVMDGNRFPQLDY